MSFPFRAKPRRLGLCSSRCIFLAASGVKLQDWIFLYSSRVSVTDLFVYHQYAETQLQTICLNSCNYQNILRIRQHYIWRWHLSTLPTSPPSLIILNYVIWLAFLFENMHRHLHITKKEKGKGYKELFSSSCHLITLSYVLIIYKMQKESFRDSVNLLMPSLHSAKNHSEFFSSLTCNCFSFVFVVVVHTDIQSQYTKYYWIQKLAEYIWLLIIFLCPCETETHSFHF